MAPPNYRLGSTGLDDPLDNAPFYTEPSSPNFGDRRFERPSVDFRTDSIARDPRVTPQLLQIIKDAMHGAMVRQYSVTRIGDSNAYGDPRALYRDAMDSLSKYLREKYGFSNNEIAGLYEGISGGVFDPSRTAAGRAGNMGASAGLGGPAGAYMGKVVDATLDVFDPSRTAAGRAGNMGASAGLGGPAGAYMGKVVDATLDALYPSPETAFGKGMGSFSSGPETAFGKGMGSFPSAEDYMDVLARETSKIYR